MKAYKDVNEWIFAQGLEHADTNLLREAWKQANRTARVQEVILRGEIKVLKENVRYLEEVLKEEMK